jgi:hypothetical protein
MTAPVISWWRGSASGEHPTWFVAPYLFSRWAGRRYVVPVPAILAGGDVPGGRTDREMCAEAFMQATAQRGPIRSAPSIRMTSPFR